MKIYKLSIVTLILLFTLSLLTCILTSLANMSILKSNFFINLSNIKYVLIELFFLTGSFLWIIALNAIKNGKVYTFDRSPTKIKYESSPFIFNLFVLAYILAPFLLLVSAFFV